MKTFSLVLLALLLFSCGTQRKIDRAKAIAYQHPKEFAEFCATVYPVKEVFIKGKDSIINREVLIKGDSIECPKVNGVIQKVKCPDAKIINRDVYRVDTFFVENTARIQDLADKKYKVEQELIEEKEKSLRRLYTIIGLSVLLFVCIIKFTRFA